MVNRGLNRDSVTGALNSNKCLAEWQIEKTLIRLLLWKQSDLHLRCLFLFVCFDSLRPSQQSFSYARTGLPGLTQY